MEKWGKGKYQKVGSSQWFDSEIQRFSDRLDDPDYEMTDGDRTFLEVIKKLGKFGYEKGIKALTPEEYDYTMGMLKTAIDNGELGIQDVSVIMGISPTNVSKLMLRLGNKIKKGINPTGKRISEPTSSDELDVNLPTNTPDDSEFGDIYEDFAKLTGEDVFKPANKKDVRARKKTGEELQYIEWMKQIFAKRVPNVDLVVDTESSDPTRIQVMLNGKPTGIEITYHPGGYDVFVSVDGKNLAPSWGPGGSDTFSTTGLADVATHINRALKKKGLK